MSACSRVLRVRVTSGFRVVNDVELSTVTFQNVSMWTGLHTEVS